MHKGPQGAVAGLPGGATPMRVLPGEKMAEPVLIDVSGRHVSAGKFQATALRAFRRRRWKILKVEPQQAVKDREDRATILFKPPLIRIGFVEWFGNSRPSWLLYLNQDRGRELDGVASR